MKRSSKLKDILFTVAFPVLTWLVMEILCLVLKNKHVIATALDIKTVIRNTGIAAVTAYALSFNLKEGRFDLSLGAQRMAGTIIGGLLAMALGLSGLWLLVFAVVFGFLFGVLTGLAFITLRVPPMVLGVGMALIWEVIPYLVSGGKGLNLFGVGGMSILTESWFQILVVVIMAVLVYILMNYTRLGYETKAVQGSQLIATAASTSSVMRWNAMRWPAPWCVSRGFWTCPSPRRCHPVWATPPTVWSRPTCSP